MPAYFNDDLHTLIYKFSKAAGEAQAEPVYDPDAEAYFARVLAGSGTVISDVQKLNISNFITGEKVANRWALASEYWSLRSSQNAGTGTVLYGLKGNSLNGSLVNMPLWGVNGITFNGSTNYIVTPSITTSPNRMVFSKFSYSTWQAFQRVANINGTEIAMSSLNNGSLEADWFAVPDITCARGVAVAGITPNTFISLSANFTATTVDRYINAGSKVSASGTHGVPTTVDGVIGARSAASLILNGTIAFTAVWETTLNDAGQIQFNQNYNTTIGQGLP